MLKRLIEVAILPPGSLLILFALAYLFREKRPKLSKGLVILSVLSLYLLSTPLVSYNLTRVLESVPPVGAKQVDDFAPKALVILGGGADPHAPEFGNGPFCSDASLRRVAMGAFWARRNNLPILVSGGLGCSHGHTEAKAMDAALRNSGLRAKWLEEESTNTAENAEESRRMLKAAKVQRILLVTSATHASRSQKEFRRVGFDVLVAPTDFADMRTAPYYLGALFPDRRDFFRSCESLRAVVTLLKYTLRSALLD